MPPPRRSHPDPGPGPGPHPRGGHPPPHHPHPPPRRPLPASSALNFVDEAQLDRWLEPLVADADDRRFVRRCLVGEGPIHHRGANFVLMALLAALMDRSAPTAAPQYPGEPVPMRLPPHLAEAAEDSHYPLRLPLDALRVLAGGDTARLDAMVDCLTDGPPQHALANVVMVSLLDRLLQGAAAAPASTGGAA